MYVNEYAELVNTFGAVEGIFSLRYRGTKPIALVYMPTGMHLSGEDIAPQKFASLRKFSDTYELGWSSEDISEFAQNIRAVS